MTALEQTFMGLDPLQTHGRLALFLRRALAGQHQAKRLATTINCTPKAAENILAGSWPNARHWAALVAAFGREITEAVFHPEEAAQRLEREVLRLEQEIAERKAALRAMPRGSVAVGRRPRAVAALEDRSAVTGP